jgi:membrane fusion protein, multidrug efflux system
VYGACLSFFAFLCCKIIFLPNYFAYMYRLLFFLPLFFVITACKRDTAKPAIANQTAADKRDVYNITSVEGFVVRATTLTDNITAAGTILPEDETELHPEASGRVVKINLPEGKTVRKGELLLKIFDEDLVTQRRKLETQLKQAEITEQRLGQLIAVKGISQQEYDLATLQAQNLRDEIELVKINLTKTELRAPYDGLIGLRKISMGAYVTPATAITTIRSKSNLKLDFGVPEKYSNLIRPGLPVQFTIEGQPGVKYNAVVQATEQRVAEDTRNLNIRAAVRGAGERLLPGSFAEVSLSLGANMQALLIPNQAIVPQARDKKVFVVRNGKAQMVTVKTGVRQSDRIEVTSGLSIGDTIAITGILFLKAEMPLTFSKVE